MLSPDSSARYDVIVVGAGNAALTAALSASQSGANVLVVEKAPQAERGGNSRFSGGLFRFAYEGVSDLRRVLPGVPTMNGRASRPRPTTAASSKTTSCASPSARPTKASPTP